MPLTPANIARHYCATPTSRQPDADFASIFAPKVTVFHSWDEKPSPLPEGCERLSSCESS
jgi:hypothetical protein